MKKIEILKLIELNEKINKNKEILSITKNKQFCFPNIEELKEEFNILRHEVQYALDETTICEKHIQNSGCTHEIRLKHYELFGHHSTCVLCGNSVSSDNCVNFEYSANRNKYCAKLVAKYQDDEDYGPFSYGYTNEKVYEIIINILKNKKDYDEVDLVQEFKKLNLSNCEINEERKVNENYILIIGGSNRQYIDNDSYLYKKGLKNALDFVEYFSGLLNTKVELIDNRESFESEELKKYFPDRKYSLKFTNYDTIEQLEETLLRQKDIPFKIIIDLSEIYEYKVSNNSFSKKVYNLKLSEYFPGAHIIRINNLSKKSLEELSKVLKENNESYGYQSNKYYYIEDNDIKSQDLSNTCNKIIKLLKNKNIIY